MSVVSRKIRATPFRTAAETWRFIKALICQKNAKAETEFDKISGLAASFIADEMLKEEALVVVGKGSRLRVYCLYDEDAIVDDDANEDSLSWEIAQGSWKAHLPCTKDNRSWAEKALKGNEHFSLYDPKEGVKEVGIAKVGSLEIDEEAFRNL